MTAALAVLILAVFPQAVASYRQIAGGGEPFPVAPTAVYVAPVAPTAVYTAPVAPTAVYAAPPVDPTAVPVVVATEAPVLTPIFTVEETKAPVEPTAVGEEPTQAEMEFWAACAYKQAKGQRVSPACPPNAAELVGVGR
jgi:hypothetical protein